MKPRVIHLDRPGKVIGPPESVSMRSGLVLLNPGESVGTHNTNNFEEIVIVLEGNGEAQIKGHDPSVISRGDAIYIPPETEHNMVNAGKEILRYIYVVARAI